MSRRTDQRRAAVFALYQHELTGRALDDVFERDAGSFTRALAHATADYADGSDAHFMDEESFEQLAIPENTLQDPLKWIKPNESVDLLFIDEQPPAALGMRGARTVREVHRERGEREQARNRDRAVHAGLIEAQRPGDGAEGRAQHHRSAVAERAERQEAGRVAGDQALERGPRLGVEVAPVDVLARRPDVQEEAGSGQREEPGDQARGHLPSYRRRTPAR